MLQYEQLPGDTDPVLVGCRYFQTKGGAEAYAAKLEETVTGLTDTEMRLEALENAYRASH